MLTLTLKFERRVDGLVKLGFAPHGVLSEQLLTTGGGFFGSPLGYSGSGSDITSKLQALVPGPRVAETVSGRH
jgi:hypothetical protein